VTLEGNFSLFNVYDSDCSGYVIGYSDCDSDPSQYCYTFTRQLPLSSPAEVNITTLATGDQCTFFGCFQYTKNGHFPSRVVEYIFQKNATILGKCHGPGSTVENGHVNYTPNTPLEGGYYVEGTVLSVTCDEGYAPSYGVSECQSDGNWTVPSLPECFGVCPEPDMPVGGRVVNMSDPDSLHQPPEGYYLLNTTLKVTCDPDYEGGGEIVCEDGGNWNETLPQCTRKAGCTVTNITGGYNISADVNVTPMGRYLVNTTVTVTCDEGYVGGGETVCVEDETWNSDLPTCSRKPGFRPLTVVLPPLIVFVLLLSIIFVAVVLCKLQRKCRPDKIQRLNFLFMMKMSREVIHSNLKHT
jgi:hypothetical protein